MPLFTSLQLFKLVELAKQNRIAPLYVFIGPLEVSLDKAKEIYRVLLEKGASLESFDLREKESKNQFLRLRAHQEGLFGLRTLYLVIRGEEIPKPKEEEILKSLEERKELFSWFILYEELKENHPFYQFALEKGALIPLQTKKKEDLLESEFLMTLREYQLSADKKTANLFISLVGDDYYHFKKELEKLVLYTLEDRVITEEKVLEIVVPSEEKAFYVLGDLIFKAGPEKALRATSALLDAKTDPEKILSFLYGYFKRLQILKDFLKENPELEKEKTYAHFSQEWQKLKESPLKEIPKIFQEAHPYSLFNMKRHLEKVSSLDFAFEELFRAFWELKREYKPPFTVFKNLFFNLWLKLNSQDLFKKAA